MKTPLLQVENLKMHFPVKGGLFNRARAKNYAVDGVDLTINAGETLGLVGESGCGKSTLGRCITRLYRPTGGAIHFKGTDLAQLSSRQLLPYRQNVQMIFQDPMESLNARHTVGELLEEPFIIHGIGNRQSRQKSVAELLDTVGLPARSATRYPFEFSGGQRQRIGIARALALKPELVICDEPVSALDVSIQSQILNLLMDLQREFNLAYLFIAHDLAVVKHISDRVAIMYLGKISEQASSGRIYDAPQHPYTRSLIAAIPNPDPHIRVERIPLEGDVPSPISPPPGCSFHTRCPEAIASCATALPRLVPTGDQHWAACHLLDAQT